MSRLPLVPDHELDDFFRERVERDKAEGRDPALNAVMAHNPELFERYFSFFYPAHEEGVLVAEQLPGTPTSRQLAMQHVPKTLRQDGTLRLDGQTPRDHATKQFTIHHGDHADAKPFHGLSALPKHHTPGAPSAREFPVNEMSPSACEKNSTVCSSCVGVGNEALERMEPTEKA